MIDMNADLSGIGSYVGQMTGMLRAVEDPRFEGDFQEHLVSKIRKAFMTETIAANIEYKANIQHVFEWGDAQSQTSAHPLFTLVSKDFHGSRVLTYEFLPSTKKVPLPDPDRYGFDPAILSKLRRHTFQLKALIMETQSNVSIGPVAAKKLFIPSEEAEEGYVFTKKAVMVNPGGASSTGQFAAWWTLWFEGRAPDVINVECRLTEAWLGSIGRKLTRYAAGTVIGGEKVGGRFASSKGVSVAYVNAQAEEAEQEVIRASEAFFDEDSWYAQFEGEE